MNPGQEKFFQFILERVSPEHQEQAEQLLKEAFQKQDNQTFDSDYKMEFSPKMLSMLKPEYVDEVKQIMDGFNA